MKPHTIEVPDKAFELFGPDPEEVGAKLLLAAAVKLFEMGEVSSGAAAELAGMVKPVFLTRLAEFGVSACNMTVEDLEQDYYLASGNLQHLAAPVPPPDRLS